MDKDTRKLTEKELERKDAFECVAIFGFHFLGLQYCEWL